MLIMSIMRVGLNTKIHSVLLWIIDILDILEPIVLIMRIMRIKCRRERYTVRDAVATI